MSGAFFICVPNRCTASFEGTAELIGNLKKGELLTLEAIGMDGRTLSLPLPLADSSGNSFAGVNELPPLADPKLWFRPAPKWYEEQERKNRPGKCDVMKSISWCRCVD